MKQELNPFKCSPINKDISFGKLLLQKSLHFLQSQEVKLIVDLPCSLIIRFSDFRWKAIESADNKQNIDDDAKILSYLAYKASFC